MKTNPRVYVGRGVNLVLYLGVVSPIYKRSTDGGMQHRTEGIQYNPRNYYLIYKQIFLFLKNHHSGKCSRAPQIPVYCIG